MTGGESGFLDRRSLHKDDIARGCSRPGAELGIRVLEALQTGYAP
jgi:hypothetical protein